MRASVWVLKRRRFNSSRSKVGEEALRHSVIVSVADRAHGRHDTHLATAFAKGITGVLAALIGMVDYRLRLDYVGYFVTSTYDCLLDTWTSPRVMSSEKLRTR